MPKSSSYFEEAWALISDADPNVKLIAHSVYSASVKKSRENSLSPKFGFNILYFWQICIRLWFRRHPGTSLNQSSNYPYPFEPIRAVNCDEVKRREQSLTQEFIQLVLADSVPSGEEFDLGYAVEVLQFAFDSEGDLVHPLMRKELSYEEWLSLW